MTQNVTVWQYGGKIDGSKETWLLKLSESHLAVGKENKEPSTHPNVIPVEPNSFQIFQ